MEDGFGRDEFVWRVTPAGNYWRIYEDGSFDVSFYDPDGLGDDPRDIDEDALWEARLYEPPRAAWKEAA